jgi:PAS domain S-box-containing protein
MPARLMRVPVLTKGIPAEDLLSAAQARIRLLTDQLQAAETAALEHSHHEAFVADVAVALTEGMDVRAILSGCAGAMVEHLGAALARIWIASASEPILELRASEGLKTRADGPYARIPIGQFSVGRIAQTRQPLISNDGVGDPLVPDQEWLKRQQLVSFAGYPLVLHDRLVGVIAMFSRRPISTGTLDSLASASRSISLGLERTRLAQSRRRLAEILEATPDFVSIVRPDGSSSYYNRSLREALGLDETELPRSSFTFRPANFEARFRETILPEVSQHGTWRGESEYVARDGRTIAVSQVTIAHRNADGTVESLSNIARDITDQKAAECTLRVATDALIEAEERTRFALDAARTATWEYDVATRSVKWSAAMRRVYGVPPVKVDGTQESLIALIHPDDRDAAMAALATHLDHPGDFDVEFRVFWPDGSIHRLQSRGRVLCDDDGRPVRVIGVSQDVTERRQLETRLLHAEKMEAVGQLAGGLAHDFNNLLTVVIGFSSILKSTLNPTDALYEDVDEIHNAGQRAAQLTRQLLAFSRSQIFQPVPLDLNALIEGITRMLGRLVGEHITQVLALDHGLGLVEADAGQIEQILVNLAVNARDAMTDGGTLTIETANVDLEDGGPCVRITVRDTGAGMDEATKSRMFEPFFTTKPTGKGTGIGLATVFSIVQQGGGFIGVTSQPGHGTSFVIHLPRISSPNVDPVAKVDAKTPTGSETVLVVEDDAAVRRLVQAVLVRAGYRVLVATGPLEAERAAAAESIDLLITDVVMPHMSGFALFSRVHTAQPEMRVLFMSGFAPDAIRRQAHFEPGAPFLHKPFTSVALATKVRAALD